MTIACPLGGANTKVETLESFNRPDVALNAAKETISLSRSAVLDTDRGTKRHVAPSVYWRRRRTKHPLLLGAAFSTAHVFPSQPILMKRHRTCAILPSDAWARAILFLDCTDAVRTRLVSHTMGSAFNSACWIGPAHAATVTPPFTAADIVIFAGPNDVPSERFVERVCRSMRHAPTGMAPLWLRYICRNVLLAVLACGGCAEACGCLASGPFWFGPEEAKSHNNLALRCAAGKGHVAVLDRLSAPPYSLQQDDAKSWDSAALWVAADGGHVATLDQLAAHPFSLGQGDARSRSNLALRMAAKNGHVAVLDRLAAPPYSLQQDDARSLDNIALRMAAKNGHVAVLDRLAAPPFSLQQEDAYFALCKAAEAGNVAVFDRLLKPPYSLRQDACREDTPLHR